MLQQLSATLAKTPGVAYASPAIPNAEKTVAIMQVIPTTDPQAEATADLVARPARHRDPRRSTKGEVAVKVGGITAAADDFANYTASRLPIFMGAVLLLSFLLLMVVFRSLLVPLKAVIMNLLSIGAAYGVVVAVFQWGWGASLIGVARPTPVEAWAPVFIFAIVFGLSMDYEVFLLSRIREEYDRTHDNATAVADGLALTARVITAAALIMVCVFGSFVFGAEVALKLLGPRPRGGGAGGRDDRAPGAGAVDDGTARRLELVAARSGSTGSCRGSTWSRRPPSTRTSRPWRRRTAHPRLLTERIASLEQRWPCERRKLERFGQVSRARHPCGTREGPLRAAAFRP